jgi:hypothetical protein
MYGADDPEEAEGEEKEQDLPPLKTGDRLRVETVKLHTGKTGPPARYTEATLLTAMEHPGKFIEDAAMREVMDKSNGIGTPATRADIIERIFSAGYVERRGKEIFPTAKGMQLIEIVPEELRTPELTAKWEEQLSLISRGQAKAEAFMEDMRQYAAKLVGRSWPRTRSTARQSDEEPLPAVRPLPYGGKRQKGEASGLPGPRLRLQAERSPISRTPAARTAIKSWRCTGRARSAFIPAPAVSGKSSSPLTKGFRKTARACRKERFPNIWGGRARISPSTPTLRKN